MTTTYEDTTSPWHAGEKELQVKLGVSEQMDQVCGMAIQPFMPDQHREFFTQLPFIVAGSIDSAGDAWAIWSLTPMRE